MTDIKIKINDVIDNIDCTKYICMIFIMVTILHVKFSCNTILHRALLVSYQYCPIDTTRITGYSE